MDWYEEKHAGVIYPAIMFTFETDPEAPSVIKVITTPLDEVEVETENGVDTTYKDRFYVQEENSITDALQELAKWCGRQIPERTNEIAAIFDEIEAGLLTPSSGNSFMLPSRSPS